MQNFKPMSNFTSMRNGILTLLAGGMLLTGCGERGESIESIMPPVGVQIRLSRAFGTSVQFELEPQGAMELRYLVVSADKGVPAYSQIISLGAPANHAVTATYYAGGLNPEKQYILAAAARRKTEQSEVAYKEFDTTDALPEPAISLKPGATTSTTLAFTVQKAEYADYAAYQVRPATAGKPSIDDMFDDRGEYVSHKIDVNSLPAEYTAEGLRSNTKYRIYALSSRGFFTSPMQVLEMETLP